MPHLLISENPCLSASCKISENNITGNIQLQGDAPRTIRRCSFPLSSSWQLASWPHKSSCPTPPYFISLQVRGSATCQRRSCGASVRPRSVVCMRDCYIPAAPVSPAGKPAWVRRPTSAWRSTVMFATGCACRLRFARFRRSVVRIRSATGSVSVEFKSKT